MSGDPAMCDAFQRGQDIHTRTAAEIHGVPMNQVTPEMRRSARPSISASCTASAALAWRATRTSPGGRPTGSSRRILSATPACAPLWTRAWRRGALWVMPKRSSDARRELFELASPNRNVRSFGERAAMNTPVQGTAADIIKLAMVQVARRLEEGGYRG